jgi:2,5-diamino-6-hydroxy-4-(5-phosphoribosylamino)pyrimidine 1'-reductase
VTDGQDSMQRPFVLINMASSVDGKITSAAREYPRMTSPLDRKNMDRLRAEADALAVGAGTMRADNPKLYVRDEEMRAYRRSLGKSAGLLKVLVTASCRLDPGSRFFEDVDGGGRIVATVEDAPADRVDALARQAEVWRLGRGRVDLAELLRRLAGRGVERLLVEGGGELNWAFLSRDLVDELHVTLAPTLLGGRDAPTLLEGDGLPMQGQRRLRLKELRREDDELYCRYEVVR